MTRAEIEEHYNDDGAVLFADGHDDAIIGIDAKDLRVVYDVEKIIERLESDGMTREEAEEFFEFNILGAYVGEKTPIYVYLE